MAADVVRGNSAWGSILRKLAWGGAAGLLLLPLVAMQFTPQVQWGPEDFILMGAILFTCAFVVDRATRLTDDLAYLSGVVVAVGTSFLLIWMNLAVGIIGDEGNPQNLLFGGVILIALLASAAARFRASGMAAAMFAAALAEGGIAAGAWLGGWGASEPPGSLLVLSIISFFMLPWLLAGFLFTQSARRQG